LYKPEPKYKLVLFNTETQEIKEIYLLSFMTAKEANDIVKKTGESFMPWIYVKKLV